MVEILLPEEQPTLTTERLVLRPFTLADVAAVVALAGDRALAENTLAIPHPYTETNAKSWIGEQPVAYGENTSITYAITQIDDTLCGAVGLSLYSAYNMAEFTGLGGPFGARVMRPKQGPP